MFFKDEQVGALLRQATAFLDSKHEDEAIRCLYQARELMVISEVHYAVETWCKLPLYLSRIGRFDEAMAAFDWLIDDLPRRARKESFMDDPSRSFGARTPKATVYKLIVKNTKRVIKEKRGVVLRRKAKATG